MTNQIFSIFDNFYDDPDAVREMALRLKYEKIGNAPGFRSVIHDAAYHESLRLKLCVLLNREVEMMHEYTPDSIPFSWCHRGHYSWIHTDFGENVRDWLIETNREAWAGVLFLTPDAPTNTGTALYRHKASGSEMETHEDGDLNYKMWNDLENEQLDEWDVIGYCGNVYNRFVAFNAQYWHRNVGAFGSSLEDGRLTQVFFYTVPVTELRMEKQPSFVPVA